MPGAADVSARWLTPYRAIVSARFRMLLQYRAAALAGLWTQIFFGLVLMMIYEAFYRSTARAQPMTFARSRATSGSARRCSRCCRGMPTPRSARWSAAGRSPTSCAGRSTCTALWYARALAWRTAPTLLRAVPMCVIAAVVLPLVGLGEWRLAGPPSIAARRRVRGSACCARSSRLRPDDADQHQPALDDQRRGGRYSHDVARDVPVRHDRPAAAVSRLGAARRAGAPVRRTRRSAVPRLHGSHPGRCCRVCPSASDLSGPSRSWCSAVGCCRRVCGGSWCREDEMNATPPLRPVRIDLAARANGVPRVVRRCRQPASSWSPASSSSGSGRCSAGSGNPGLDARRGGVVLRPDLDHVRHRRRARPADSTSSARR